MHPISSQPIAMNRILIAEDEPRIVSFLQKGLQSHGFATTHVADGSAAVQMVWNDDFDLLILDLGLPDKDGFEALAELRGQGASLPIVILTARDDIADKVAGLEGGADDYITKPFRFEELLARIRVRLRTANPAGTAKKDSADRTLRHGKIALNLRTRKARVGNRPVELSAKEFLLAETLLRHPGQVMSRAQLLDRVWGYDYDPGSNIVDVYIGYLRKKFGKNCVETVRGVGYRLRAVPS